MLSKPTVKYPQRLHEEYLLFLEYLNFNFVILIKPILSWNYGSNTDKILADLQAAHDTNIVGNLRTAHPLFAGLELVGSYLLIGHFLEGFPNRFIPVSCV